MKPHSTSTQNLPENDSSHPNDDGCILGTAGRDEDPNATTDWDHESDSAGNVLTPEDARGLPGYPSDSENDQAPSLPPTRPSNGETETDIETPEQNNDRVD
ncbi:hypothetical protein [Pseudomonas sp. LB3P25]